MARRPRLRHAEPPPAPGPAEYPTPAPDSSGIPGGASRTVLVSPFNDPGAAERIVEDNADELAAVIVEPLQRAIRPEPGFLGRLREVTRDRGVLLVFDEIVTGFRLARGGAQERYGRGAGPGGVRQDDQRRLPAGRGLRPRGGHGPGRPPGGKPRAATFLPAAP